jgi:hypothetical protein
MAARQLCLACQLRLKTASILLTGWVGVVQHRKTTVYAIEKQPLGYKLVFQGSLSAVEMQRWLDDSRAALSNAPPSFGLLMDMRALQPLALDSQRLMLMGQQLYQRSGMHRSVVIVQNPMTRMLFTHLARESGIYQWERYISAESTPDWEPLAWAWIQGEKDPDS